MSVGSISVAVPQSASTYAPQHGHHAHGSKGADQSGKSPSAADAKASESIEQLAADGDPTAIAELKAERQQASPAKPESSPPAAGASRGGAKEPGKGEQVDAYA